mmetsp:Transcript_30054/g.78686  ORF Transcript_30054/g.78686 Transcript_30054/m.78686 type:complete len:258 (-) Transcript_30054:25-798(-)
MASVLKIGRGSQIYRVVIEGRPDFEGVDVAVRRVLPGCGAADATFSSDGGEAHPLTPHSVEAFLATGRALASGQVVLRLDVPEVCEELSSATRPTLLQSAAATTPAKLAKSRASWAEDPRPLDELVAGLQDVRDIRLKKSSERKDVQNNTSLSGARGACSGLAQACDDPCAPGKRDPDTDCGDCAEERGSSAEFAARSASSSDDEDLPPEPAEVWPPTPDSTPQHSPRFDYQMGCSMAADLMAQQQFVWVPVLVPVF